MKEDITPWLTRDSLSQLEQQVREMEKRLAVLEDIVHRIRTLVM